MVIRLVWDQDKLSSILRYRTKVSIIVKSVLCSPCMVDVAEWTIAPDCDSGVRGFEFRHSPEGLSLHSSQDQRADEKSLDSLSRGKLRGSGKLERVCTMSGLLKVEKSGLSLKNQKLRLIPKFMRL